MKRSHIVTGSIVAIGLAGGMLAYPGALTSSAPGIGSSQDRCWRLHRDYESAAEIAHNGALNVRRVAAAAGDVRAARADVARAEAAAQLLRQEALALKCALPGDYSPPMIATTRAPSDAQS